MTSHCRGFTLNYHNQYSGNFRKKQARVFGVKKDVKLPLITDKGFDITGGYVNVFLEGI